MRKEDKAIFSHTVQFHRRVPGAVSLSLGSPKIGVNPTSLQRFPHKGPPQPLVTVQQLRTDLHKADLPQQCQQLSWSF